MFWLFKRGANSKKVGALYNFQLGEWDESEKVIIKRLMKTFQGLTKKEAKFIFDRGCANETFGIRFSEADYKRYLKNYRSDVAQLHRDEDWEDTCDCSVRCFSCHFHATSHPLIDDTNNGVEWLMERKESGMSYNLHQSEY